MDHALILMSKNTFIYVGYIYICSIYENISTHYCVHDKLLTHKNPLLPLKLGQLKLVQQYRIPIDGDATI